MSDETRELGSDIASLEAQVSSLEQSLEILANVLKFAVYNSDKFTENDPDGIKHVWIKRAVRALNNMYQPGQ